MRPDYAEKSSHVYGTNRISYAESSTRAKGGAFLNIIFHYPTEQKDLDLLMIKVATVHADAVKSYVNALPCKKEQKLDLIKAIQKSTK
jgi:hypothetical protein